MMRSIKKAVVQDPIVLAAPLQTRLEERPISKTILSPHDFSLDMVQKVALGLLIVPSAFGFAASLLSANGVLLAITGVLLLLCGLMLWVIRLRAGMSWEVTWYGDHVAVRDGRYGRTEQWSEPIAAYIGLKRDFGLIPRGGQYTPGREVHGLLMVHEDQFKSILLHAAYEPIGEDIVRYCEEQLDLKLRQP